LKKLSKLEKRVDYVKNLVGENITKDLILSHVLALSEYNHDDFNA